MKRVILPLLLGAPLAAASLLDGTEPITLDQGAFTRILNEVRGGNVAAPGSGWKAAMLAEDAELMRVLLLVWLQELNPQAPMGAHAQAYAAAVRLHLDARAGRAAACASLAQAYRTGELGDLQLPACEEKARGFEQRALVSDCLPE